jgi:two-component system chemotaxis response regulator CheB
MPATFTRVLASHLAQAARRPCAEAEDGDAIAPGRIYVAPGGFHMVAESQGVSRRIRLLTTPPENFCRPAADPMLRSLAEIYGARVLAIILTGMGHDGMGGAEAIVAAGGNVAAQDEATSVVWGMPGAAATAGLCCAVLPLGEIGGFINRLALAPDR